MIKIALLGFGNVGQAFARLILSKEAELLEEADVALSVVGIATRTRGAAVDQDGIDLARALDLIQRGEPLHSLSPSPQEADGIAFIQTCGADVLIELTPVSYGDGRPAVDHLRAALQAGMHAITANKGPVVHAHQELSELARDQGRRFLFESTVMDGAPLFSLWRETLPVSRLVGFRGVLNSTTNLILTLMEDGQTFQAAVEHAQSIGIAETDPSGDIEGWDAAIKVAALVTALMGAPLTPQQVDRKGIEDLTADDFTSAMDAGERWKLICQAERREGKVAASVRPERVAPSDPLFGLEGTSSAITFLTDTLGPLTIREDNPGPETTAYGLLADLLIALRQP